MNVLQITWVFPIKAVDLDERNTLYNTRCWLRGNFQVGNIDYDPKETYVLAPSHETFRILLSYGSSRNRFVEGGDVANAYLFCKDFTVYIEQPTNSTGKEEALRQVCLFKNQCMV